MSQAIIKLESFTSERKKSPQYSGQAVRDAYDQGFAAGKNSADRSDLKKLSDDLIHIAELLRENEARRKEIRSDALNALSPILSEILDALCPGQQSQKLERELIDELQRLAQTASPLKCRILCHAELRPTVENILISIGSPAIEMSESAADGVRIELSGGRIEFDKARITSEIRNLISEIKEIEE